MITIYAVLWLGLLILAFINASARELLYNNWTTKLTAHQISTITGCIINYIYARIVTRRWPVTSYTSAFKISFLWVSLTVIFESFMVLVLMKRDIAFLLDSYDILKGNLWLIFLIWMGLLPIILKKNT